MIRYEWKIATRSRVCQVLFCSVILVAVFLSYMAIENSTIVDEEYAEGNSLTAARQLVKDKNRSKGKLTPARIIEIINIKYEGASENQTKSEETSAHFDILYFANSIYFGEHADDDDPLAILHENTSSIENIYSKYRENLIRESREYGKTKKQQAFLMNKFNQIEMPVHYEAFDAWEGVFKYIEVLSIILLFITAFISARIFAQEFRYRSGSVFFSALHGRSRAIRGKIVTGLLLTTVIYWVGIGLLCLICFLIMGTSGGQTMFQFDAPYAIYIVSFRQLCCIAALCGYISCLLASAVAMLIAAKTKGVIIAITIPVLLFFITPYLVRNAGFHHDFLILLPYHLNNILNCSRIPYIFQVGGFVFRQIPALMVMYSGIAITLLPMVYRCYRNTVVDN